MPSYQGNKGGDRKGYRLSSKIPLKENSYWEFSKLYLQDFCTLKKKVYCDK